MENRKVLFNAILTVLRPLARVLLRNGGTYKDFAELAKWIFVDVAREDFTLPGRKQSASRISVVTGLTRKEVARQLDIESPDDSALSRQYNRAARVIAGWRRDPEFQDADGRPGALSLSDQSPGFTDLVRKYSGDMPARAVLDELERVGSVRRLEEDRIGLVADAYIPAGDEAQKLLIMGKDTALLLDTIEHNLCAAKPDARFQRKVAYDNLPPEALPEFRKLSSARAQALLEELDVYLSRHDRDENPAADGGSRIEAGLGIYYFETPLERKDT